MTNKSDVTIDFTTPSITWGNPLDENCMTQSIEARGVTIQVHLYGEAIANKTKIMAGLRRSLKFFVRGGVLCDAIDFNAHVKLFLVTHPAGTTNEWGRDMFTNASLGKYAYGVCLNLEEPSEMVVFDTQNVTTLVSDDLSVDLRNRPACIEFVKSEGGVLFMPHLLGLDALSHQAVVAQRIRRDMWRRTRPGAHFTDYGILELHKADNNIVEVWLGVSKVWAVDLAQPFDIVPDTEYFSAWDIEYILEDRSARKRMAEFTVVNFNRN